MRRAGEVVRTAGGVAVVRCSGGEHPDIGRTVVDDELDEVGEIVDVFGPVDRPYLAVSPAGDWRPARLLGRLLYVRA